MAGGGEGPGIGIPGVGGPGLGGSVARNEDPPRPPDPPATPKKPEQPQTIKLISTVLQGKAIQKVTPPYNQMAKNIRLQGDVAVEVIVSPEGRVESARVVSGHPLFARDALEAARGWRFQPTLLNNVPVRVTGVITFVFRIGD